MKRFASLVYSEDVHFESRLSRCRSCHFHSSLHEQAAVVASNSCSKLGSWTRIWRPSNAAALLRKRWQSAHTLNEMRMESSAPSRRSSSASARFSA